LAGLFGRDAALFCSEIGAAFPHKEGIGFSIELKAFPIDGRLVVLPPDSNDDRSNK
jgi:hypothetical protein